MQQSHVIGVENRLPEELLSATNFDRGRGFRYPLRRTISSELGSRYPVTFKKINLPVVTLQTNREATARCPVPQFVDLLFEILAHKANGHHSAAPHSSFEFPAPFRIGSSEAKLQSLIARLLGVRPIFFANINDQRDFPLCNFPNGNLK